ncbi:hypothetical protein EVC14_006 [Rhizobium phage RHph_I3_18]|nr:hypothetical protein EVC14_006 [Rhizobium phage RHph_I3_18]
MTQRFCRQCSKWHDVEEWPVECYRVPAARSDTFPVPNFISDHMEPLEHPLTGKFYTSKREFSAITRERGYEEVGNDPARLRPRPKPKADRKAIKDSVQKAMARFNNGERVNLP